MIVLAVVHFLALMTQTVQGVCDSGWVPFNDSCYFFSKEWASWNDSMTICERQGGWLVHDDSNDKHNWIVHEMKTHYFSEIWIGGTMNNAGVWIWEPNSQNITTSFWSLGRLYDVKDSRCIRLSYIARYMWSKVDCQNRFKFICEQRKSAKTAAGTVAFTAVFDSDRDIAGGQTLIFNKVLLNSGSGYDNTTGIFTAPSDGIYVFHINGLTKKNSDLWIELIHNQEYVVSAFARQGSDYDVAGNSVTQRLKKNDTVYVRARRNAYFFGRPDDIYATFSGYRIGMLSESDGE